MDFIDLNEWYWGIWALMGGMLTVCTVFASFGFAVAMLERRNSTRNSDIAKGREYARSSLLWFVATFFTWAWPLAAVVGITWLGGVVLKMAELPTPLSIWRARQAAKIEELKRQIAQRKLEAAERERYTDELERRLGVGKYAA